MLLVPSKLQCWTISNHQKYWGSLRFIKVHIMRATLFTSNFHAQLFNYLTKMSRGSVTFWVVIVCCIVILKMNNCITHLILVFIGVWRRSYCVFNLIVSWNTLCIHWFALIVIYPFILPLLRSLVVFEVLYFVYKLFVFKSPHKKSPQLWLQYFLNLVMVNSKTISWNKCSM